MNYARDRIFNLIDVALDKYRQYDLHPLTLLLREAQADAAAYARQHMKGAMAFRSQTDILRYSLGKAPAQGLLLEFGVAGGTSIRHIASSTRSLVHGFDSFEGLPEDWSGRHEPKGAYSTGGQLPVVPGNVKLHRGWFNETLPPFLKDETDKVAFLHIDCDLYSSTKTVLDLLADRMLVGTVILFDEYFNYLSWRDNEFKAFHEFVEARHVQYEYIAWAYQQVAVVITA